MLASTALAQESAYHPHGVCYLWQTDLVWTHMIADGLIALAYYSIPVGLVYFLHKRKDIPFDWMFGAFAVFIFACGTTHVMAVWTLWNPDYWIAAWVKIVTAGASLATAGLMIPLIPKMLRIPSPTELRNRNEELARAHDEIELLNGRLRDRLEELATANSDLETFASSISHDMRAPLRSMAGFSTALLEDCGDRLDETCADYAVRIADSARRMDHLIQDLLDYTRLARAEMSLRPVALEPLFGDAVASVSDAVETSGATIRVDPTDLEVAGHQATLLTMVTNLLVNAVTYVPEERDPEVQISAERIDGGRIRIRVADNGIGVAVEYRERIFQIFERLHGLDRYPGTGIGLATVAKGAYRMGGRAGVESEVGRGSTFWIELKAAE